MWCDQPLPVCPAGRVVLCPGQGGVVRPVGWCCVRGWAVLSGRLGGAVSGQGGVRCPAGRVVPCPGRAVLSGRLGGAVSGAGRCCPVSGRLGGAVSGTGRCCPAGWVVLCPGQGGVVRPVGWCCVRGRVVLSGVRPVGWCCVRDRAVLSGRSGGGVSGSGQGGVVCSVIAGRPTPPVGRPPSVV